LIYHFPVRSRTQFESKVRQGGDAYARNSELHPKAGWHWRRWRRMLDAPGGLDATLEEALPSGAKLAKGLADGSILMDATMAAPLRELARAGPRSSKAQRL
jgi:hypothetical protein